MNRDRALAAGAAAVVLVSLVGAVAVPGVLSAPEEGPTRPGFVEVSDLTIQVADVTGATVTLRTEAFVQHRGNPTENVTVRFRAIDSESGLLETSRTVDVGDVSGDREVAVPAALRVEREGGYRIEVVVYADGERLGTASRTVAGLEATTPPYARTPVGFSERDVLPPLDVAVEEAGENRTRLRISAWLTNGGDEAAGDLRLTVVLRQAESNLVAAREDSRVGEVAAGRTTATALDVSVPSEYNYYVDAVLWKGGVVVDTARTVVNLDPTRTIRANQSTEDVDLEVSDFERQDGPRRPPATSEDASAMGAPGFGPVVAVAALLVVALLARRVDA